MCVRVCTHLSTHEGMQQHGAPAQARAAHRSVYVSLYWFVTNDWG